MFGAQVLPLGKVLGIKIGIHPSWFVIFVWMSWVVANDFGINEEGWSASMIWASAVATSLLFFVSILMHELGHSVMAKLLNVSVRSITLFLFGGAAELGSEPKRPRDEFLIAIAGPAVSLLLGAFFVVLWIATPGDTPLNEVSHRLGIANLGVAIFNMVPGFPLDGGRVLRSFLWAMTGSLDKATQWSGRVGMLFGRILIGLGIAIGIMTQRWFYGLLLAFMGWFLVRVARATVTQSIVSSRLRAIPVEKALEEDLPSVDGWDTLEDVVREVQAVPGKHMAVVSEEGEPVGIIGEYEIAQITEGKRAYHVARQVMTPLARLIHIDPQASLLVALRTLDREGVGQLLVQREGGEFLGVLTRDQLRRVLQTP